MYNAFLFYYRLVYTTPQAAFLLYYCVFRFIHSFIHSFPKIKSLMEVNFVTICICQCNRETSKRRATNLVSLIFILKSLSNLWFLELLILIFFNSLPHYASNCFGLCSQRLLMESTNSCRLSHQRPNDSNSLSP